MRFVLALFLTISLYTEAATSYLDLPLEPHLERAKAEHKPLLLFFHAAWCTYCVKLEDEVFKTGKADEVLKNYIFVGIDVDTEEGKKIKDQYNVSGYPTQLFVDCKGMEYNRELGYENVSAQLKLLEDNKDQVLCFDKIESRMLKAKGEARNPILMEMLRKKYEMAKWEECIPLAIKFMRQADMASYKKELRSILSTSYIKSGDKNRGLGMLLSDLSMAANADEAMQSLRTLRSFYKKENKAKKSLALYEKTIKRFKDARLMNSYAWDAATNQGDLDKALAYSLEAVQLSKGEPNYIDTLAEVYLARQEWDLAEEKNNVVLKAKPQDKDALGRIDKIKAGKAKN